MHNEFTAIIEKDKDGYIACSPEIPGANGQGRTVEECKKNLAEAIGLFGSYASGSEGERSDIDILVQFEQGRKTFDNTMDLRTRLEELFDGRSVDLAVQDALKPTVRPHVLENVRHVGDVISSNCGTISAS